MITGRRQPLIISRRQWSVPAGRKEDLRELRVTMIWGYLSKLAPEVWRYSQIERVRNWRDIYSTIEDTRDRVVSIHVISFFPGRENKRMRILVILGTRTGASMKNYIRSLFNRIKCLMKAPVRVMKFGQNSAFGNVHRINQSAIPWGSFLPIENCSISI